MVQGIGRLMFGRRALKVLWTVFAVQVAGRLLDLWWHATHDEFESGADQVQAHWLVWLGTALVLVVGVRALGPASDRSVRVGYLVLVIANALYVPIASAHFIQHVNREEVAWAHIGLGTMNAIGAVGVLYVTYRSLNHLRGSQ